MSEILQYLGKPIEFGILMMFFHCKKEGEGLSFKFMSPSPSPFTWFLSSCPSNPPGSSSDHPVGGRTDGLDPDGPGSSRRASTP